MTQTIGHGTQLELGNGATPEVFASISGVVSAARGSNKVDTIDNTDMGTTGNGRTFIGGLENPGDLTVKINVKPGDASQASLFAAKDGVAHNFKLTYPGAVRTLAFPGIVESIDEDVPDDKLPTYNCKIKISGPVTIS